jgi:hypothetical protein
VIVPVPVDGVEGRLRHPGRLPRPSQHHQDVGEGDVRLLQALGVLALYGELPGQPERRQALVAAADVGEVDAERRERVELRPVRADGTRERQGLLADRQRLVVPPGQRQSVRQRRQRLRPLRRGRLRRDQLDGAREGVDGDVGPAAPVQVATEPLVQAPGAPRVALAGQLDGSTHELDRPRRRTRLRRQLGRPEAERGQVEPHELGRVGHGRPQRERPLQV